ncbi:MAG: TonB-dependent receptor [Opitutales bacterium]
MRLKYNLIYLLFTLGPLALAQNGQERSGSDSIEMEETTLTGAAPIEAEGYRAEFADAIRLGAPLEELPLPVQIFTSDFIEDVGAVRLDDVLEFAGSVQRGNAFGNTNDRVVIRGFDATYAEDGVSSSGAIASILLKRDASTIERVEVLRGPSSALFGETAPGGIINLVTKRPQPENFVAGRTVLSSFERYRQEFDGNIALGENGWAQARLSGAVEHFDSFRDFVNGDRYVLAPAIDLELTERFTLAYRADIIDDERPFDRGIPVDQTTGEPLAGQNAFYGDPTVGDIESFFVRNQLEGTYRINDQWQVRALGSLGYNTLEGAAVEPIFLAPETVFLPEFLPFIPANSVPFVTENVDIARQFRDRDFETYLTTGRIDVAGQFDMGGISHDTLAAFEVRYLDDRRDQDQTAIGDPANLITVTTPNLTSSNTNTAGGNQLRLSDEAVNFGFTFFDKVGVTEQFDILLGGRLDWSDLESNSNGNLTEVEEFAFSPVVGAVYRPVEWGALFVRYSESFELNTARGDSGTPTNPADDAPLDPRESYTIEGGIRLTLFEKRLTANATYFFIEQENFPIPQPGVATVAAGTAESKGLELSVQGELFESLSLIANYTYLDAEFTEAPAPAQGSSLQGAAEHSASLFANYELPPLDPVQGTFSLRGGIIYVGERLNSVPVVQPLGGVDPDGSGPLPFLSLPNVETGGAPLDAYVRVDMGIGYELEDWLQVAFTVQNVFDEDYSRPSSPGFTLPEPPRTFTGSVSVRF